MNQTRGQITTWILIVLAVLLVGGGAWYFEAHKTPVLPTVQNSSSTTTTVAIDYKTFNYQNFSFQYPGSFVVSSSTNQLPNSFTITSPTCKLFPLEFNTPIYYSVLALPNATSGNWWLTEFRREFPGSSIESKNLNDNTMLFRIDISLGSSSRKWAIWIFNNYDSYYKKVIGVTRLEAFYDVSLLNYNNSTGQKVYPSQGSIIINNCTSDFENILNSFMFKKL